MSLRSLVSVGLALLLFGGLILLAGHTGRVLADEGDGTPFPVPALSLCEDSCEGSCDNALDETGSVYGLCLRLEGVSTRFALLLRVEAPEGWRVEVQEGDCALSARRFSFEKLLLLADGVATGEPVALAHLRVYAPSGADGTVRVLPSADIPYLYYLQEADDMIGAEEEHPCPARTCALTALNACSFAVRAPNETVTDDDETGELAEEKQTDEPYVNPARYIGCQEAIVRGTDDSYRLCVRFLFQVQDVYGDPDVPCGAAVWLVLCRTGGVPASARLLVKRAETVSWCDETGTGTYAPEPGYRLLTCTYSDLPVTGEIFFAVVDCDGELRQVYYRDGRFVCYAQEAFLHAAEES